MAFDGLVRLFVSAKPWVGPIGFDASLVEDHAVEYEITDAPIEGSSVISDHVLRLPRTLVLTVAASSLDGLVPFPQVSKPARKWRALKQLADTMTPVDVVTSLEIYTSMLVQSISVQRSRETTGMLPIVITLRELQFASIDVAASIADAALDVALGEADVGAQSAVQQATADLGGVL